MDHFKYTFTISGDKSDMLIAFLSEAGCYGFEELPDQLLAFTLKEIDRKVIDNIIEIIPASYSISIIPEINWNAEWEAGFEPVDVLYHNSSGIFVHLKAHFHPPCLSADHEIIITPKMSFGTGHHATTYGMIRLMSVIDFNGKVVADFGTGTGVLAILAEKLG